MNTSRWQGRWKQLRGGLTQMWGRLSNDALLIYQGEQDAVNGRIQERLGRLQASYAQRWSAMVLPFRR